MAASGISPPGSKKKPRNIKAALSSAVLEWLLMLFLFLDGIFSYLITKFACFCELQTPCLLCSRLDRILGKYNWDLICRKHKSEISCLVLCHAHNKLVDVRGMCETCLFSFATINKSNAETYRLLVGKLGESSGFDMDENPLFEEQISSTRICSCCNSPWTPKGYRQNLLQMTIFGSRVAGNQAGPLRSGHQKVASQSHPLSHIWYKELKINSDSESEVPLSDEGDDAANYISREFSPPPNVAIRRVQMEPRVVTQPNDFAVEKLIDALTEIQPPVEASRKTEHRSIGDAGVPPSPVKPEERTEPTTEDDDFAFQDAKEMITEESTDIKLKSVHEIPSTSVSGEAITEALRKNKLISEDDEIPWSDTKETLVHTLPPSRLISLVDVLPTSSGIETPVEGLKQSYVPRPEEILQAAAIDADENCKTITTAAETSSETIPVSAENCQQVLNMLDLGEAYKLAVSSRGRQLSGVLAEQWTGKDSSRISDDLKHLFSQFSNTRDQSVSDTSPRLSLSPKHSANSDELRNTEMQKIQSRISADRVALERNESGHSLDGSIVSEIEGETLVDRLTRQIEHDKKLLANLYKELEEERNSSSIAVNQAMAMITRLQEEKATLQMEALQCVRMMEEQAEYDMEALQKANDLLTAREKEIQDLEAELEYYRIKYPDEYLLDETMEPIYDMNTNEIEEKKTEVSSVIRDSVAENPGTSSKAEESNMSLEDENLVDAETGSKAKESNMSLEDENSVDAETSSKAKESNMPSGDKNTANAETSSKAEESNMSTGDNNTANVETSGKEEDERKKPLGDENEVSVKSLLSDIEDERSYILKSLKDLEKKLARFPDYQLSLALNEQQSGETGENDPAQDRSSTVDTADSNEMFYTPAVPNIDVIANEVYELNERLKALEADKSFIEHSMSSAQNGEEGLKFVQEIASHLRELRKAGIRSGN